MSKLVPYSTIDLDNSVRYRIEPKGIGIDDRFRRTMANLNKLLQDGRPCCLIIPERGLSSDEIEEYRKYFCQYAKEVKKNCIYVVSPVSVWVEIF